MEEQIRPHKSAKAAMAKVDKLFPQGDLFLKELSNGIK